RTFRNSCEVPEFFGLRRPGRRCGPAESARICADTGVLPNLHGVVLPVVSNTLATFLLFFSALFSIVNPIGGALIYSQVTLNRAQAERRRLAWRVALYSAMTMLVALWAGAPVLSFFGIS